MDVCNEDPHPPAQHRSPSPTRYAMDGDHHDHSPRRHQNDDHEHLHVDNSISPRSQSDNKRSTEPMPDGDVGGDPVPAPVENHVNNDRASAGDDHCSRAPTTASPGFIVNRTYASVDNPTSLGSENDNEVDERRRQGVEDHNDGGSNNHDPDHDSDDGELRKNDIAKQQSFVDAKRDWMAQMKKSASATNGPAGYPPGLLNGSLTDAVAGGGAWTSSSSDVQTPGTYWIPIGDTRGVNEVSF